jgi:hypothetical protein
MNFRFKNPQNEIKSYIGFIWGKSSACNYFFIADNGKYGYGKMESRYITEQNIYGYSNWFPISDASDRWFTSNNFVNAGINKIEVERKGDKYLYKLNGQTLFIDNILNTVAGNMVGIGIGDAVVDIDFLKISQ